MNSQVEKAYISLPSIETIKSYTVKELEEEMSILKVFTNINEESKIFHATLHICQLISINTKKFITNDFIEYKDKENSNFMIGNVPVTNGATAILTVATTAGLFPSKYDDAITAFEFKTILDSLDPSDKVSGKVGAYLRRFIERSLIKEFQKSAHVQASERLRVRFIDELKKEPFDYDGEFFTIVDNSFCEDIYETATYKRLKNEVREEKVYRDIINKIPLWYGHNAIMETKHIHQLLIDVVCTKENVNFKVLFVAVKERVKDWLLNTPLDLGAEIGNDEEGSASYQDILPEMNPLYSPTEELILENEVKNILKEFDETEKMILKLMFELKTIEETGRAIGLGKSATAERVKKIKDKLGKTLTNKLSNLNTTSTTGNDFEMSDLMLRLSDELNYLRITPEIG